MEVKKIIRKATAIAASASFVGATLLGAMAQDLASYPAPFVKDGQFDAFIVVGANAQPADVVGAVDIGASLQFALKKQTSLSVGAAEATISSGVKIEKAGNKFNYGDSIQSIEAGSSLSSDDLPDVLADGKYVDSQGLNKNSVTYTQRLKFNDPNTAKLVFTQNNQLAPTADAYLKVSKNSQLYNFTLEFDSAVEYDNSTNDVSTGNGGALNDFKTTTITIQGQTYTITDVALVNGVIDKLTMLSGEAILWLTQNNPITKSINGVQHTVEVVDVTEGADACQVKVDDVTAIIDKDQTQVINGVQIGVTDVRAIHAQLQDVDVCQLSLGATQLELQNGQEVKVDDVTLDGSNTEIVDDGGNLRSLTVTYKPLDQNDDIYLTPGKEFSDPIFKSWKIVYGGLSADYVNYSIDQSGSENVIYDFLNNGNKEVQIPAWLNTTSGAVQLGTGETEDEQMIGAPVAAIAGDYVMRNQCMPASGQVTDCEGLQILASTPNGEAHVLEISNIKTNKNQTDIKDDTTGAIYKSLDYVDGVPQVFSLGSLGNMLNMTIDNALGNITVWASINGKIETSTLGSIQLNEILSNNVSFFLNETDRLDRAKIGDEMGNSEFEVAAIANTDKDAIELHVFPVGSFGNASTLGGVKNEKDSDFRTFVSDIGTQVVTDTKNKDSVSIMMPKAEVFGNVFVAPMIASVSTAAGGSNAYTISKLNVGAAKLDSEITDATADNLIIVGGPCANTIAAQVLGLTYPACGAASGIAQDTGIIKEVAQSTGKVALVVAGWESIDTRRATRVLANFDQYALSGEMVTVTGTSLTNIQVQKSA